jgi:2-polyprenyl-3-methyl-5-hydroxy-6-metoxy-1,4-benzoquinol methylase
VNYYSRGYRFLAPFAIGLEALLCRNPVRRQSLINRQRDYLALGRHPELFGLHRRLDALLADGVRQWKSYDYGEGYFYQSYGEIHVSGLRDTEQRIAAMDLPKRVAGARVLEVGCNTGFLTCQLAASAAHVDGCDIAPHLLQVAGEVAAHRGVANCSFHLAPFETFEPAGRYDVVISFANHATYDGNTSLPLSEYLEKCRRLLADGGTLLFESHPPQHEKRSREELLACIGEAFEPVEAGVLDYGTFLDRNRLFVVARRRPN